MNFHDFNTAVMRAKAYQIPCVICKLLDPKTPIKKRNPFFLLRVESLCTDILKKATVEACVIPFIENNWVSGSKVQTDIFRRN